MNRFSLDGIRKRSWLTLFNPLNGQQSNEMNMADTSDGEGTIPASEAAAGSGGKSSALCLSHARDEVAALTEKVLRSKRIHRRNGHLLWQGLLVIMISVSIAVEVNVTPSPSS